MPVTLEKLTTLVITHGQQFGYNLGGWFVIPLFMIQIFNILIRRMLVRWRWRHKETCLFVGYLGLGVLGVFLSGLPGWRVGWELVIVRMLTMLPFFGLGILYRTKLEKYDKLKNWIYFLILLVAQIIIVVIFRDNPTYEFCWGKVGMYGLIMPFISGVIGVAFWLRVSKILEPVIGKSKIVNAVADNSFSIMINQFAGFWLVNAFFAALSKIITLTNPFNWTKFKTTVWYHYVPFGMLRFEILYLIAGILVPILMQVAVNKIMKVVIRKKDIKGKS